MVVFFCGSKSICAAIARDVLSIRVIKIQDIREPRYPEISIPRILGFWIPRYHTSANLTASIKQPKVYLSSNE